MRYSAFLSIMLLFFPIAAFCQQVNVVVVAIHGIDTANKEWQPTISYLNTSLPQHNFTLLPYTPDKLAKIKYQIKHQEIDFVITQPAFYVDLERNFGISKILTMVKKGGYSQFGSAIIVRADSNINSITDLHDKTIAGVARLGFGGWLLGYQEMLNNNFDPYADARKVVFLGTQPAQVQAVLKREVDAAVIRTGILEKLAAENKINIDDFHILAAKSHPGFSLMVSTALYPEWAFARTRKASNELSKEVALALLSVQPDSPIVQNAGYQEWTFPYDYQPVHDLLKTLQVGPYHDYGKIDLLALIAEHWLGVIISISLSLTVLIVILISIHKLEKEVAVRRLVEQSLRASEERFRVLFNAGNDAVFVHKVFPGTAAPYGTFIEVNTSACQRLGYSKEELLKLSPMDLDAPETPTVEAASNVAEQQNSMSFERVHMTKSGKKIPVEISAQLFEFEQQTLMLSIARDITARKKAEQALAASRLELEKEKRKAEELARTDPLTGLKNRRAFFEAGGNIGEHAQRYKHSYSVIMIDVDHFKYINDTYGHSTGDKALVIIAETIVQVIRTVDIPGRIGGEEFAIVLPETSIKEALKLAERLRIAFANSVLQSGDKTVKFTASLGVSENDTHRTSLESVLKHADKALYKAKEKGRNQVVVYTTE